MIRPKQPCAAPGCAVLVARGFCELHTSRARVLDRQYQQQRGNSHRRGYDARWRQFRIWFLSQRENSLCRDCGKQPATDVHHVRKLKQFPGLKYEPSNCRALCRGCHAVRTLRGE